MTDNIRRNIKTNTSAYEPHVQHAGLSIFQLNSIFQLRESHHRPLGPSRETWKISKSSFQFTDRPTGKLQVPGKDKREPTWIAKQSSVPGSWSQDQPSHIFFMPKSMLCASKHSLNPPHFLKWFQVYCDQDLTCYSMGICICEDLSPRWMTDCREHYNQITPNTTSNQTKQKPADWLAHWRYFIYETLLTVHSSSGGCLPFKAW